MKCTICNKPVELKPTATERAAKYGGKPSDYTSLFPTHAECQIRENQKRVSQLMREYVR
jgi:hypothetical protein